jgi:hypothetical protein
VYKEVTKEHGVKKITTNNKEVTKEHCVKRITTRAGLRCRAGTLMG